MTMPRPVRIFHITAIDNLPMICQHEALWSKAKSTGLGITYNNIAHKGAQSTRANKEVINPPGGSIHDYVPFYFAPRSPMLSAIHNGRVEGCKYSQTDIIYFELTIEEAYRSGMREYIFFDRNATIAYSKPSTDLKQLHTLIDWELLTEQPSLDGYCKFFHAVPTNPRYTQRLEKRMAEFLIKEQVPLTWGVRIGVANQTKAQEVNAILRRFALDLPVVVMPAWYF